MEQAVISDNKKAFDATRRRAIKAVCAGWGLSYMVLLAATFVYDNFHPFSSGALLSVAGVLYVSSSLLSAACGYGLSRLKQRFWGVFAANFLFNIPPLGIFVYLVCHTDFYPLHLVIFSIFILFLSLSAPFAGKFLNFILLKIKKI